MNHLQHYWDTLLLNLKSLRSFIKDKNKNRLPKCVPADSESRIPLNTLGFLEELEMLAGCEIDEFAFYEDYNDAFVGVINLYGEEPRVCYDYEKVISILISQGMSKDEAIEYFEYNVIGTYCGERTPCFITLGDNYVRRANSKA